MKMNRANQYNRMDTYQHRRWSGVVFCLLLLLAVIVVACSSDTETVNPAAPPTATSVQAASPAENDSGQTEQQSIAKTDGTTATIAISETADAPDSEAAEGATPVPTIGDAVAVGSLVITVTGVTELPAAGGNPATGSRFVVVDVTVANTGSEEQTVSSLLQMSLRDEAGEYYTPTLNASVAAGGGTLQTPDSVLVAGEETQGRVGFELPDTSTGLLFVFDTLAEAEETVAIELALP